MSPKNELDFEFHIPTGRQQFRVWEVAEIICHSSRHVEHLIEEGAFGPVIDARRKKAKKSSAVITRAGLVKFLKERKR
jgi:hypothetical protein